MVTIAAWTLVVIGAYLIAINYRALVTNHRNRRSGIDRHHSFVPILGGLLGSIGAYLLVRNPLAFVVAAVDPGVWVLALLPVALLRHGVRQKE
jgi:hypothetical protein